MNPLTFLANAKAAFTALMTDHLRVDQSAWSLVGIDVDGDNLVFRCEDMTEFWEHLPFSLSVPADVVAAGFDADVLLAIASQDDNFLYYVRSMHEQTMWLRLGRKAEIEVDLLLTEEERQDRDSQRYVDYYVRLGVDPAFL